MNRIFPTLIFVSAFAGCVHTKPPVMSIVPPGSCRSSTVTWFAPERNADRERLASWCAGVGPTVLVPRVPAADAAQDPADILELTFVSWNVHVGNGDIRRFVDDLRAGRLTPGRPVRHFVLLVQEAARVKGAPPLTRDASGARRIDSRDVRSADIGDISRDLGLALIYVPSMRNGDLPSDQDADRGSAILSTLPLSSATAVELPGERQRRVAIIARVEMPRSEPVSVGVIHLDALGASRRLWLFWTPLMREIQVKSMESLLPDGSLVLGADLNTWHGTAEPAPRYLADLFSGTTVTVRRGGLGVRVLDYLYLRAPAGRTAYYEEVPNDYGSDHRPLVGWIN